MAEAVREPARTSHWLTSGLLLIKFPYHITFVAVMFGALIFADNRDRFLAWRLFALYLSFNVLLYSGLYALNDLADRESDAAHPRKRHRPLPSGRVSVRVAKAWTAVYLALGLATGAMFGSSVLACYLAIIAINLSYSWGGRNVAYLDVVLNGLPHVVRFLMGVLLVGRQPPLTHLAAFLFAAVAFSCLRRRIERGVPGWEARQSLRVWTRRSLDSVTAAALAGLLALAIWRGASAPGVYLALIGASIVFIGGAYTSRHVRRLLQWVWVH